MIFGRSNQQQGQTPQGNQTAGGQANSGYVNQTQASGPQPGMGWQSGGGMPPAGSYPTQQSGTGYAGYTPGPAGSAYGQGAYGSFGYAQNGSAYGQGSQNASGYVSGGWPLNVGPQAGRYGQGGTGFSQPGGGYPQMNASQGGYPQMGGGVQSGGYPQMGAQGNGYSPAGGYPQMNGYAQGGSGGYSYPQMNGGYGQYQQGQGYAQMGRNQQPQQSQQIPLNGGGYVPQQMPVRKAPFVFNDGLLILLSAVLLALFAVGLFVPQAGMMLWLFLGLAAVSIVLFWARPLLANNKRLSFTIIFAALGLVAALRVTNLLPAAGGPSGGGTAAPTAASAPETAAPAFGGSGTVIDPQTGAVISAVSLEQVAATTTPEVSDTETTDRLELFFRYWSANMQDEMLTLCAPSWQSSADNPKSALFYLLANRKPIDYTVEKVSGTSEDTSRTVTVTSTIDRNNGKDPVKYRLSVLMVKEGGVWYVDPQSLKTYEEADTPDPAIQATPAPTKAPAANANTVLYYNPDGGTKYHLDQNCKSTHAKYLPMKGHFTYAEINDAKYKNLSPCNVCAAPLR